MYGTKEGSLSEDEILKYWFDGKDTLEKNFLYNAIYLTILIPNAGGYSFKIDDQKFSVSRQEMKQFISKNIQTLPDSNELFDKEKAQQFIDYNKEKINKTAKSAAIRQQFFKNVPIIITNKEPYVRLFICFLFAFVLGFCLLFFYKILLFLQLFTILFSFLFSTFFLFFVLLLHGFLSFSRNTNIIYLFCYLAL